MNAKQKTGLGAALATFGGGGIAFIAILGLPNTASGSRLLLFLFLGIAAGLGAVMVIKGLLDSRGQAS